MLVTCLNCLSEFDKSNYQIKKHPNNFCSKSCSASYNNRKKPKRNKEGVCLECGNNCSASRKFCSNKCKKLGGLKRISSDNLNLTCLRCKISYPKTDNFFYKGKNFTYYCKSCLAAERVDRLKKRKQECVDYKGGKCKVCSYSLYLGALEFHHLDPNKKDFGIAQSASKSFENLKPELDKCVLLCSRCHREVHGEIINIEDFL